MYEQYKRYTNSLDLEFNIANSAWINSSVHENAKEEFLNKAKSYYNSEVFLTPFKRDAKLFRAYDISEIETMFSGYKYGTNTVTVIEQI